MSKIDVFSLSRSIVTTLSDTCSDLSDLIKPEAIAHSGFFGARRPPAEAHRMDLAPLVTLCKLMNACYVIIGRGGLSRSAGITRFSPACVVYWNLEVST